MQRRLLVAMLSPLYIGTITQWGAGVKTRGKVVADRLAVLGILPQREDARRFHRAERGCSNAYN
ncbi:hypothetical protein HMPREF0262_03629 [Clostridium sp. ATCC 29733]|nr:hypothetical protein HMPREF0262_03629 [Clostridium sp. ATCC 29733]